MDRKNFEPSDLELEILKVLWEIQPATVRMIHEQLLTQDRVKTYSTTSRTMDRMFQDKGMIERSTDGKLHYYTAVPKKEEIQQTLTEKLVEKAFSGSAMKMVMHTLGSGNTTAEELEALQNWLDQQKEDNL